MTWVAESEWNTSAGLDAILVVDNDKNSAQKIRAELKRVGVQNHVHRVATVVEMLAYLHGYEQYADRAEYPWPAVIIMDSRLPGVDGFEADEWLRSHEDFSRIPVVMIGRKDQSEALKASGQQAGHGWMFKPFNGQEFEKFAKKLELPVDFGVGKLSP